MTTTRPWRVVAAGLRTVLGLGRRGYFIPARHAAADERVHAGVAYPAAEAVFARRQAAFRDLLAAAEGYAADLRAIGEAPPPAPRWRQSWFPRLDAAIAYTLVRTRKPSRIVEVGSGHSTRFLARAVRDEGIACRHVAIDPAPRAALAGLPVEWIRAPLQEAGEAPFAGLATGDMLIVDSSHVLMPGSDVDRLFNRVLPGLPAGVLVHIHDVFLPDGYPRAWAWRGYNEQLAVLPLLLGGGFAVEFASHYVATRMADALAAGVIGRIERFENGPESSLWLAKQTPPAWERQP